jgi:peptidoglycan/LPS O-acetylase OafA/YrhL
LVGERDSPRYFRTFYVRRAFRIFPLYYLVFLSYCGTVAFLGPGAAAYGRLFENPVPFWTYALYLQNFALAAFSTFGPIWMAGSWSLAVEEQFYFTLPAIVRLIPDKALLRLTAVSIVAAPLLRASIQRFKFLPSMANYVLLPTCIDSLAVGVLVMLLLRRNRSWLQAHLKTVRWSVLGAASFWTVYPYLPNPQAIRMAFIERTGNSVVFGGVLLLIMLSPKGTVARCFCWPVLRKLGNLAYSTYLLHPILLCIAFQTMRHKDPILSSGDDLLPLSVALISTLMLSFASWTCFERKLIRVGHQFQY